MIQTFGQGLNDSVILDDSNGALPTTRRLRQRPTFPRKRQRYAHRQMRYPPITFAQPDAAKRLSRLDIFQLAPARDGSGNAPG